MPTYLKALAALSMLAAAAHAPAQETGGAERLPMVGGGARYPHGTCAPQVWPREALRYEIEGVTQVNYKLSPDGRVLDPVVAKSSGWALLDNASLQAARTCTYTPEQAATAQDRVLPMQFVWVLEGQRVHPSLVPGSCVGTGVIDGFQPYDKRPTDATGVKVRFMVAPNGQPMLFKLEGNPDAALAQEVVRHLITCRFAFDPQEKGEHTDTMTGRVLLR